MSIVLFDDSCIYNIISKEKQHWFEHEVLTIYSQMARLTEGPVLFSLYELFYRIERNPLEKIQTTCRNILFDSYLTWVEESKMFSGDPENWSQDIYDEIQMNFERDQDQFEDYFMEDVCDFLSRRRFFFIEESAIFHDPNHMNNPLKEVW